ncbi:AIPR family protein [Thauera sinica]|uniref:AIPR family protein n=1 Tax=Thauera sinica TaxID=2665146 RepID=A0ABW1AXQ3_9RHOO|nr:AIPR family protein [Thauera sp. K11]
MKDTVLESYLHSFAEQYEISSLKDDEKFEHFVNFCIVSKQYPRNFDFEDASLGGGDDAGLDGAAVIINGIFVTTPEQVREVAKRNGYLDVDFYLIQSKSSSKFKGDQVGTFLFGVKSLFDEAPSMPENDSIQKLRRIREAVYELSIQFTKLPSLNMYFVTTGEWKDPDPIRGRAARELRELGQRKMLSNQDLHFIDADKLKSIFRELQRRVVKEIRLDYQTALPEMDGVTRSFLGALRAKDFVLLLSDDEGNLQKSLFYDNVRDFQGHNAVNREIHETLSNPVKQTRLALLNNGVTIISKQIEQIGSKLKLSDFQVVNGCQTSNIVFEQRAILSEQTYVPVKIIETNDPDIITEVVEATNSQTEVKREAFESLRPFHKELEEYYNSRTKKSAFPIYYERRSKQYQHLPAIKPNHVITLAAQVKAYVATFLRQPHSNHRYYGELLDSYREKLFVAEHDPIGYYTSSLLFQRISHLFENRRIDRKYKDYKFHLMLLITSANVRTQALSGKEFNAQCEASLTAFDDRNRLLDFVTDATKRLDSVLAKSKLSSEVAVRSKEFTNLLVPNASKASAV